MSETLACEDCGATMCRHWRGIVAPSNPPRYPWEWRCHQCGRVEPGGSVTITTGTSVGRCET